MVAFALDHAVNGRYDNNEFDLRDLFNDFMTLLKRLMSKNGIKFLSLNDVRVTRALKKGASGRPHFSLWQPCSETSYLSQSFAAAMLSLRKQDR